MALYILSVALYIIMLKFFVHDEKKNVLLHVSVCSDITSGN